MLSLVLFCFFSLSHVCFLLFFLFLFSLTLMLSFVLSVLFSHTLTLSLPTTLRLNKCTNELSGLWVVRALRERDGEEAAAEAKRLANGEEEVTKPELVVSGAL